MLFFGVKSEYIPQSQDDVMHSIYKCLKECIALSSHHCTVQMMSYGVVVRVFLVNPNPSFVSRYHFDEKHREEEMKKKMQHPFFLLFIFLTHDSQEEEPIPCSKSKKKMLLHL